MAAPDDATVRARSLALAALAAMAAAILALSFIRGDAAAVGTALLAAAFPFLLMALGALAGGRLGRAALPIAAGLAMVELAMAGMLALRGQVADGLWVGGLPLATALLVYGLFLLPLAVVSLGFAFAFRRLEAADEELDRLRRLAPKERA